MGKRKRKHKRSGHYCWCCGRRRPNERFSGRGHRRHLCRDCAKLGKVELEYRQGIVDADRLMAQWLYRRKAIRKRALAQLQDMALTHPNERVRAYVQDMLRPPEREPQVRERLLGEQLQLRLFEELAAGEDWEELREGACEEPALVDLDE